MSQPDSEPISAGPVRHLPAEGTTKDCRAIRPPPVGMEYFSAGKRVLRYACPHKKRDLDCYCRIYGYFNSSFRQTHGLNAVETALVT